MGEHDLELRTGASESMRLPQTNTNLQLEERFQLQTKSS